jgi:hypothetical protein
VPLNPKTVEIRENNEMFYPTMNKFMHGKFCGFSDMPSDFGFIK